MRLESLTSGQRVHGIEGASAVQIVAAEHFDGTSKVIYERPDGTVGTRMLTRPEEPSLTEAHDGSGRPFDADGDDLRLASEALRHKLSYLFDPYLAVHAARVEPLPHQITAVYEEMLGRQPLRYLLADDPGAGKTIMTGLLVKELIARGDLARCLIVAPGNLVEQWQAEMHEKFDLDFVALSRAHFTDGVDVLDRYPLAIARLDALSRNEDLQARLEAGRRPDLVVFDEAHKLSASYTGGEVKYTRRYRLGERLGRLARHLLLLTATPHNGKQEDFELFMSLIDDDRFEGRDRSGGTATPPDASDLMRRLLKEELLRFDGTPLFPERRAHTVTYALSEGERDLYAAVTSYVREEMNRAERFVGEDDRRRVNVGFALQILQRRLASSPEAIYRSLERRRERLAQRLADVEAGAAEARRLGQLTLDLDVSGTSRIDPEELWEELEDAPEDEVEATETAVLDQATAAATAAELRTEIATLGRLEATARAVRRSGEDAKWNQLNEILDDPLMVDADGNRRKLIVFTEARDTLGYLADRIRTRLGRHEAVVEIHGGVARNRRLEAVASFVHDPETLVLVANDAAGEGVNLQRAHLMVNYDLPWNPNRLEQRFGRIHRIGQREVCHLWNLVAPDTREGEVYARLLEKLEVERAALGGRVYDVLGRLFEEEPLRALLLAAVRYGDDPEVKARLDRAVDGVVDRGHLETLLTEHALVRETVDAARVGAVREAMERAEARRLQPHFVRSFFLEAFTRLGGVARRRKAGRWEITRVPYEVRERARQLAPTRPLAHRYERVVFARDEADDEGEILAPGHPLLDAVTDLTLEGLGSTLARGAILVDDEDPGDRARVLFHVEQSVTDGRDEGERTVDRSLRFVEVGKWSGDRLEVQDAGDAPYLDYRALRDDERAAIAGSADLPELAAEAESVATSYAMSTLVSRHLEELRAARLPALDKIEREVTARLTGQINYWDRRAEELKAQERSGRRTRLSSANAAATAEELAGRLDARRARIARERELVARPPSIRGAAIVVPAGLLSADRPTDGDPAVDAQARRAVELAAMRAVEGAERALGFEPRDVSERRGLGYDIESRDPATGHLRFIEVKGRSGTDGAVTLTKNEILCARNEPERFRLAIVVVGDGTPRTLRYIREVDFGEPGFGETSRTFSLGQLLERSEGPH